MDDSIILQTKWPCNPFTRKHEILTFGYMRRFNCFKIFLPDVEAHVILSDRLFPVNFLQFNFRTTEPFSTNIGTKHPWVKYDSIVGKIKDQSNLKMGIMSLSS